MMNDLFLEERPVLVTVQGKTHRGMRRAENQDHFLVADLRADEEGGGTLLNPSDTSTGEPGSNTRDNPPQLLLGLKGALILVADGMGGGPAGSVASRMAAGWVHEQLMALWSAGHDNSPARFASCLRSAIEATNAMVHQQSERYPQYRGMGTTVTAAGILGDCLYLAQVGDSRAYLVRDGVATQLTRDQSLVQELIDSGAITEADAESNEHRNVILQALGALPGVQVDLTWQQLRQGDTIVLCSDGLFRTVHREEIALAADDVHRGITPLMDSCERLVTLANERGGPDNVTVVIAHIEGPGLKAPQPGDRVERRIYEGQTW
ncbi:MAG: protein phosphatase 2C domain-containing protein [Gemmatimonadota bacterium]|jgi:protein phosphatase|nr:protein phosphatase 2C domain-containing protein [Gemmatimonadota bacterium]